MSNDLIDQLAEIVPSIAGMTNALGVPELGVALTILEVGLEAIKGELSTRTVTPAQAKATIDELTQAAITAKFNGK